MSLAAPLLRDLQRAFGKAHVVSNPLDLAIFERDGSNAGAMPDAIVLPATAEEVQQVVRLATERGVPVVARGAGTGLSGGAVTLFGGIALQVSRMRRIE